MIARVWDRTPEQASQIWEAAQTLPALAAEFDDLLNGIPIASERAKHMREYQQRTGGETRTLLDPPPHERVASALDRFDKGDRGAFWADLL